VLSTRDFDDRRASHWDGPSMSNDGSHGITSGHSYSESFRRWEWSPQPIPVHWHQWEAFRRWDWAPHPSPIHWRHWDGPWRHVDDGPFGCGFGHHGHGTDMFGGCGAPPVVTPVPEPPVLAMMALGLTLIGWRLHRRR